MVTRKSAVLSSADRQEIADLFSPVSIKAEARLMNASGIGHGDADREYLVTTGCVTGGKPRVYCTKRVWAQSAEEGKSIAMRQAMGIGRMDKTVIDGELEDIASMLAFTGTGTKRAMRNRKHYAIQGSNWRDTIEIDGYLDNAEMGYKAQAMPLQAVSVDDCNAENARLLSEHEAIVAPLMAGYQRCLAMGDKMLVDGYKRDLKAVGVRV